MPEVVLWNDCPPHDRPVTISWTEEEENVCVWKDKASTKWNMILCIAVQQQEGIDRCFPVYRSFHSAGSRRLAYYLKRSHRGGAHSQYEFSPKFAVCMTEVYSFEVNADSAIIFAILRPVCSLSFLGIKKSNLEKKVSGQLQGFGVCLFLSGSCGDWPVVTTGIGCKLGRHPPQKNLSAGEDMWWEHLHTGCLPPYLASDLEQSTSFSNKIFRWMWCRECALSRCLHGAMTDVADSRQPRLMIRVG